MRSSSFFPSLLSSEYFSSFAGSLSPGSTPFPIEFQKKILGVIDSWGIFGVVLHGSQILDARYWILDHALEIVAVIQHQATSNQHQYPDSENPSMGGTHFYYPKTLS